MKALLKKAMSLLMGIFVTFAVMAGTTQVFAEINNNASIAQRRYDYFKEEDYKTGKVPTFDEYTNKVLAKQNELSLIHI